MRRDRVKVRPGSLQCPQQGAEGPLPLLILGVSFLFLPPVPPNLLLSALWPVDSPLPLPVHSG